MISAVAQTLGRILANETSIESLEAISFDFSQTDKGDRSQFILYFYNIKPISCKLAQAELFKPNTLTKSSFSETLWFDIFFLLSTKDRTSLGTQRLLSEALKALLQHNWLDEKLLAPALRGCGSLPLVIHQPQNIVALWQALEVSYRPALYLSVTAPLRLDSSKIDAPLKLVS